MLTIIQICHFSSHVFDVVLFLVLRFQGHLYFPGSFFQKVPLGQPGPLTPESYRAPISHDRGWFIPESGSGERAWKEAENSKRHFQGQLLAQILKAPNFSSPQLNSSPTQMGSFLGSQGHTHLLSQGSQLPHSVLEGERPCESLSCVLKGPPKSLYICPGSL